MTWVKLDTRFFECPQVLKAGPRAAMLFVVALCYCSRHRQDGTTNGLVPLAEMARLAEADETEANALAQRLVAVGLWSIAVDGYRFVNYLGCGLLPDESPREEWDAQRGTLAPLVYARDGFVCRYCGATNDLTVDHLIPLHRGGANTLSNLAVACRPCNSAKGAKTPTEWLGTKGAL